MKKLEKMGSIIRPNIKILGIIQDRKTEKELAKNAWGNPVEYRIIDNLEGFQDGVKELGDTILKTRMSGYDGKWQWKISQNTDLEKIWNDDILQKWLKDWGLILEKKINLDFEASVILGVDIYWNIRAFDPIYNIHEAGILRYSITPAPINDDINRRIKNEAEKIARGLSENVWWYIGLLTIEFFITKDWEILVNEFAPRPHNSGHITLDSHGNNNQNDVWLQAVMWNDISGINLEVSDPWIMENILSQKELVRALLKLDQTRTWYRDTRLYNYEKIDGPSLDPQNTTQRKLGHLNHVWWSFERWIEKMKRWEISLEKLLELTQ
jgi:5-(carboxyamino)imidazole ribonucleotide synthase